MAWSVLAGRRHLKKSLRGGVLATVLLSTSIATADAGRVAVLGPDQNPLVPRLQRNFASKPALLATATVKTCSRDVVARMVYELEADTAICTDGDIVTVWRKGDGDTLTVVDALPIVARDDRAIELLAARVTLTARTGRPSESGTSMTIAGDGATTITPTPSTPPSSWPTELQPTTRDTGPVVPPPPPPPRVAPRLALGVGPAVMASAAGGALGLSINGDIAVSRSVAMAPWVQTAVVRRDASGAEGSALYRPTLLGLGLTLPLAPNTSRFVPRLGVGYAILWLHVTPEQAVAPAQLKGDSIDLFGAVMYANAALSVKVTRRFRVAAEGMFGVSSHDLVVRIGDKEAAHWGVPLASLALRGEVVFE